MIHEYKGNYTYNNSTVSNWKSTAIGVYYCGYISSNKLIPLYVGKGVSSEGIRGRLLDHLNNDSWPDVTSFGYCFCDTVKEVEDFETSEIARLKPKYNIKGK